MMASVCTLLFIFLYIYASLVRVWAVNDISFACIASFPEEASQL